MASPAAPLSGPDRADDQNLSLPIAEVSRRCGLSKHTLRYYEKAGLLSSVGRSAGGRRRYEASDLDWLAFPLRLQATGMPISDMQRFGRGTRTQDLPLPGSARRAEPGRIGPQVTNHHHTAEPDVAAYVQGADQSEDARYLRGRQTLDAVDGESGHRVIDALADIAPALGDHVIAYGFGDVYSRPGLTPAQRQLVTLGMLTALGGCEAQLEVHVNASLNVGLSATEIVEAIVHSAVYSGFPKALNAIFVAKAVFAKRDLLPVTPPAPG